MYPPFRQTILIAMTLTGLLLAQGPGPRGHGTGMGPCGDSFLSLEQRTELHDLVFGLRGDDVPREEIRTAVSELFTSWGIDPPEFRLGARRHGPGHWAEQLTEQQRTELHELLSGLREDGASREEIHAAVTELFTSWGIDPPEQRLGRRRRGPAPWAEQLTEQQRTELHELVSGLREDGATRDEIHAAVVTQLAEWGIDWNFDCPGGGHLGDRPARVRLIQARNYPNPFNPSTQIAYTLTEPALVEVAIYNLTGRLMRSYHQGIQPAGSYSVYWNGRTADGLPAPSGVYFYRIQAGNELFTDRMLLMK